MLIPLLPNPSSRSISTLNYTRALHCFQLSLPALHDFKLPFQQRLPRADRATAISTTSLPPTSPPHIHTLSTPCSPASMMVKTMRRLQNAIRNKDIKMKQMAAQSTKESMHAVQPNLFLRLSMRVYETMMSLRQRQLLRHLAQRLGRVRIPLLPLPIAIHHLLRVRERMRCR